jgi:hypothetical protein
MPHTSLTVEMGSRSRPFDLHTEVIRVGHADHCELVLPFDWVHPEHFTLQWRAGAAYARAISGQTLLNSRPLSAEWAAINTGDELRIPSPAGKPISILVTQLGYAQAIGSAHAGSTLSLPQPTATQASLPTSTTAMEEPPHVADSHMAAIAAVSAGVLLVGISLAIYLALATTTRPTRLTTFASTPVVPTIATPPAPSPTTPAATLDTAPEISDLKSQIPDPAPPPATVTPAEIPDLKSEISNLPPQVPPSPPQSAIGNRQLEIDPGLTAALAARQSHRDSAKAIITTAPHLPEPMRSEIFAAVAARLTQDFSPSAVTVDPSATIQGDGQTAVLRAPITITNARGATYRTQVAALLSPTGNGWTITYLEVQ